MEEKLGIKETLELLASCELALETIDKCIEDGKISASDAFRLIPLLVSLKDGLVGISDVKKELSDLDNEELEKILNLIFSIGEKAIKVILKIARM